jgi:DNA-binding CsgD family transcriptional regulator
MKRQHQSLRSELTSTPDGLRLWQQEKTILSITELICKNMKLQGVSRTELANRMQRTPGYVTQLLDGTANMTIRTISDAFTALGLELEPVAAPVKQARRTAAGAADS